MDAAWLAFSDPRSVRVDARSHVVDDSVNDSLETLSQIWWWREFGYTPVSCSENMIRIVRIDRIECKTSIASEVEPLREAIASALSRQGLPSSSIVAMSRAIAAEITERPARTHP